MKKTHYRHGDWSLVPTDKKVTKPVKHKGSYTFAEGEATNHFHTIVAERPQDFTLEKMPDGSYLVEIKKDVRLTHPEHSMKGDLVVTPGTYHLNQRREKDWFQLVTRRVID